LTAGNASQRARVAGYRRIGMLQDHANSQQSQQFRRHFPRDFKLSTEAKRLLVLV
jgi:hypothetical protein